MTRTALIALLLSIHGAAFAWGGYDYENGNHVEVERGNLVRQGREIEVYDYGENSGYKNFEVESIKRRGSKVELEVRDTSTGEYRTFEMDGDQ